MDVFPLRMPFHLKVLENRHPEQKKSSTTFQEPQCELFLSASGFGPFDFSLGLLLKMASAIPSWTPLGGDSKDNATSKRPQVSIPDKTKDVIAQVFALKETCEKYDKCENSREFSQEDCQTKMVPVLLDFQVYLDYMQNKFEGNRGKSLM
ncbi:PREDICTED: interleukin-6-like [Elephantulus edwardii]|uniref:interleukin-6-like n=1 Tax=Elephantulus edwardii TaxID=28737 RepID=UPI0003F08144|nr:PREDICTED: interleukin-6-like [Elephantulus edwardii]